MEANALAKVQAEEPPTSDDLALPCEGSAPNPPSKRKRESSEQLRAGYAVVATATVEIGGERLPPTLMKLWPERFASITAAKKACRCSHVLINGSTFGSSSHVCQAEDVCELLARVAAGPAHGTGRRAATKYRSRQPFTVR